MKKNYLKPCAGICIFDKTDDVLTTSTENAFDNEFSLDDWIQ